MKASRHITSTITLTAAEVVELIKRHAPGDIDVSWLASVQNPEMRGTATPAAGAGTASTSRLTSITISATHVGEGKALVVI